MRLYKTARGNFAGTQALADTVAHRDGSGKGNWIQVDVPTDKPGLINWLNDRGPTQAQETLAVIAAAREPIVSGPAEPMSEDAFEALPLALQLHLAALAVENARDQIKGQ